MAALDFPSSPTVGQTYTANGRTWQWDGVSWNSFNTIVAAGSNTQIQFNNSGAFGASSNLTWNGTTLSTAGLSASSTVTINGGTANGVGYLNASKVLTTGTALVFDGTNLSTTGTATATKLVPTGNVTAGNGMYLPTTNTLAWSTNGTERARITSTGVFQISSSGSRLEFTGSSGDKRIAQADAIVVGGAATDFAIQAENNLLFATGGTTERLRLDSSGNLGLGVTPSAWGSAYRALQIGSSGAAVFQGNAMFSINNAFHNGTNWIYQTNNGALVYELNRATAAHIWYNAPSGTAGNAISFTQAMTLTAAGNLGIGTSSPGTRLDVAGSIRGTGLTVTSTGIVAGANQTTIDFLSGTGSRVIAWGANTSTRGSLRIALASSDATVYLDAITIDSSGNVQVSSDAGNTLRYFDVSNANTGSSAGSIIRLITSNVAGTTSTSVDIVKYKIGALTINNNETNSAAYTSFGVGASERMRITSAGNLLVGTTSALGKFTLQGAGATSGTSAIYVTNSTPAYTFVVNDDGSFYTGASPAGAPYNATTGTGANLVVTSAGQLLRSTSSLKYKTDVQDATHGLADALKLRAVTYKGKNDGSTVFGGLIAEEVHEAGLTEFVQYAEDGSPDALSYGNMVSLAFKAIQELHAEIESLKQRTH